MTYNSSKNYMTYKNIVRLVVVHSDETYCIIVAYFVSMKNTH